MGSVFRAQDSLRHCAAVEHTPQTPPDAKAGPRNYRERDVEDCTRPCIGNNKRRDESVPDPDTYPGLPPRKAKLDHGRGDHPSVQGRIELRRGGRVRILCAMTYVLMLKLSATQLKPQRQ